MRDKVVTPAAPAAVGPYSQAVRASGFMFASGQIPLDPVTQEIAPGGITRQTEQVLRNVANLLQAAGSNTANIVRCVVYLRNMADFAAMNQAYALFFGRDAPARTTVAVSALPEGCAD
jgi:2-iminobutanoate/2-iminopropanoate deaminase